MPSSERFYWEMAFWKSKTVFQIARENPEGHRNPSRNTSKGVVVIMEIIFGPGSVPVNVAARVYGKDASWIRAGISKGWLPIGYATNIKNSKRTNYYISPKKLYEDTGYVWKGEKYV